MSILNGQALLAGAMSGLTNTYSTIMNSKTENKHGLTMEDLSNLTPQTMATLGYNNNFLQYLTSNFNSFDNDGDGVIDGKDMKNVMNTMQSKGLSYNEIQALCINGNADSTLLNTVLSYFNKIDANGDGRVTSEEITKFGFDCQQDEALAKYKSFRASQASLYYNDGVEDDLTSVLDEMRPNISGNSKD